MSEEFLKLIANATVELNQVELLIDTNVVMEIDSIGDLLKLGDKLGSYAALSSSPEYRYRQLRSRYSNLLAWWLNQTQTPAAMLGNEVVDQLEGKLAPEADPISYAFTTGIVHVIRPYVWKWMKLGALLNVDHHAVKEDADSELLRIATEESIPLITNEGLTQSGLSDVKANGKKNLRGRSREAGVQVFTPQEFLEDKNVDIPLESERFCSAIQSGVYAARRDGVLMGSAGGREVMSYLVGWYRWVILDEVAKRP